MDCYASTEMRNYASVTVDESVEAGVFARKFFIYQIKDLFRNEGKKCGVAIRNLNEIKESSVQFSHGRYLWQ